MLLASTCLLAFRSSERRMCFLFPVYKHVTPKGGEARFGPVWTIIKIVMQRTSLSR